MLPDHFSASRVKLADKCMLAYRYRYIDQVPEPTEGARKIFGTVVHNGVQLWYDSDFTKTQLASYIDAQWWEKLPQEVAIALRHVLKAERDLADLEQLVCISRPEIKAPRQTKAFVGSSQFKRFEDARDELLAASTKSEEMRWPQNENAFQAYQKSMVIARNLQARWQHRPRPLAVEQEFRVHFAGVDITGRIDQVRADPDPQGQVHVEGVDLKTGTQLMTQMDAFIQAFLYNEACHQDPALPVPEYWTFWMARPNRPQHARIDRERHSALAQRILQNVKARIEAESYAPQYGMWCGSCDYRDLCESEISIWEPGTDSLVLDDTLVLA